VISSLNGAVKPTVALLQRSKPTVSRHPRQPTSCCFAPVLYNIKTSSDFGPLQLFYWFYPTTYAACVETQAILCLKAGINKLMSHCRTVQLVTIKSRLTQCINLILKRDQSLKTESRIKWESTLPRRHTQKYQVVKYVKMQRPRNVHYVRQKCKLIKKHHWLKKYVAGCHLSVAVSRQSNQGSGQKTHFVGYK